VPFRAIPCPSVAFRVIQWLVSVAFRGSSCVLFIKTSINFPQPSEAPGNKILIPVEQSVLDQYLSRTGLDNSSCICRSRRSLSKTCRRLLPLSYIIFGWMDLRIERNPKTRNCPAPYRTEIFLFSKPFFTAYSCLTQYSLKQLHAYSAAMWVWNRQNEVSVHHVGMLTTFKGSLKS